MDEMQMITEAIGKLGQAGRGAFTWWIVKEMFKFLMVYLGWTTFFFLIWNVVKRITPERD